VREGERGENGEKGEIDEMGESKQNDISTTREAMGDSKQGPLLKSKRSVTLFFCTKHL
jgi:hypothetical protein